MALNNYERMAHASIRGSGLRIHGSQQLFYSQLSDCALACSAAADCGAFVHNHHARPFYCSFKKLGAAGSMIGSQSKDVYVKKLKRLDLLLSPSGKHGTTRNLTQGDSSSRIIESRSMLSEAEAESLRVFAIHCFKRQRELEEQQAAAQPAAASPPTTETITVGSSACPAGSAAALLSRLEVRIARLTGLPFHQGEEPLMLTRQRPHEDAPWLDGSRVHHDRINPHKARRVVTVLTYLTSVLDVEGGHTIFPVLRSASAEGAQAAENDEERVASEGHNEAHAPGQCEVGSGGSGADGPRDGSRDGSRAMTHPGQSTTATTAEQVSTASMLETMAQTVSETYHRGTRALGCQQCAQQAAAPPTPSEAAASDAVHEHARAECRRCLQGQSLALSVRPQAGRAITFWHTFPNGTVDARMWHAGCVGRSGPGRIALRMPFPPRPAFEVCPTLT